MQKLIIYLLLENILFLPLLAKDRNEGERDLFRTQQWTASNVVLLILPMTMFILVLYLLAYHLSRVMNMDLLAYVDRYYLLLILSFNTPILIFVFYLKKEGVIALGIRRGNLIRNIIIGITVTLFSWVVLAILFFLAKHIRPYLHFERSLEVKTLLSSPLAFIIYFSAIVLWSPIVEESIFRGILYSPYRKKYGPTLAIIISSLLFSLIHFENAPGAFLKGILWGVVYEETESIVSPMAAHSTHNLLWVLTQIYYLTPN